MKLDQIKSILIKNKKNLILALVALIVILGVAFALNSKKDKETVSIVEGCKEGYTFSETTGEPCSGKPLEVCAEGDIYDRNTGKPCAKDKETTSKNGSTSYESALKKYAGRSLIFDSSCVSSPAELSVSMGSSVLLANNSDTAINLSAFGKVVNLRPYHYMLGTVSTTESEVSCNDKVASKIIAK